MAGATACHERPSFAMCARPSGSASPLPIRDSHPYGYRPYRLRFQGVIATHMGDRDTTISESIAMTRQCVGGTGRTLDSAVQARRRRSETAPRLATDVRPTKRMSPSGLRLRPMPFGGEREAFVAPGYNTDAIQQIARYGLAGEKSSFVGNPDGIIPGNVGPDRRGFGTGPKRTTTSPGV